MLQLLEEEGIKVGAHICEIAGVRDFSFDPVNVSEEDFDRLRASSFPVNDPEAGEIMKSAISAAKKAGDSVGGVIECAAIGLPAGVGDPMFDGMENMIACTVFAIPAVKGIEFGSGFTGSRSMGSANNDPFTWENGMIRTLTNNHGGILGTASGMPLIFRVSIKPTPSISIEQETVSFQQKKDKISIKGRHDPCIVPRAIPCVESAASLAICDSLLGSRKYTVRKTTDEPGNTQKEDRRDRREAYAAFLERMQVSADIAVYKKEKGLPIRDPEREREAGLGDGESIAGDAAYMRTLYLTLFEAWQSSSAQTL